MGLREPGTILLIILLVAVLFGSRKLPDLARGVGQSMRIFKSEIKQMKDEEVKPTGRSAEATEPLEGKVVSAPEASRVNEPVHETPRTP